MKKGFLMKFGTHALAGIVLSEVVLKINGFPLDTDHLFNLNSMPYYLPIVASCLVGSVLPDVIDAKIPFLKHRTYSHSPYPYIVLSSLFWFFSCPLSFLFFLSGFLHVFLDSLTVSGIPLGDPGGRHFSFKLVRNGSGSEVVVILLFLVCAWGLTPYFCIPSI